MQNNNQNTYQNTNQYHNQPNNNDMNNPQRITNANINDKSLAYQNNQQNVYYIIITIK